MDCSYRLHSATRYVLRCGLNVAVEIRVAGADALDLVVPALIRLCLRVLLIFELLKTSLRRIVISLVQRIELVLPESRILRVCLLSRGEVLRSTGPHDGSSLAISERLDTACCLFIGGTLTSFQEARECRVLGWECCGSSAFCQHLFADVDRGYDENGKPPDESGQRAEAVERGQLHPRLARVVGGFGVFAPYPPEGMPNYRRRISRTISQTR